MKRMTSLLENISLKYIAAFFTLFLLFTHGYYFAYCDQNIYIPVIKRMINSSLYSGDYFFLQPQGELTFFPILMSCILNKFPNFEIVFFCVYLIFSFILFLAVAKITYLIFKEKIIVLIVLLISCNPIPIAGTFIMTYDEYTHPRLIATAIILVSLYFFLQDRYILSSAAAALGFLIHPLLSIGLAICIIIYILINRTWKTLIKTGFTFLLFSSPFIYKFLTTKIESTPIYPLHDYINLIGFKWYLFPLQWDLIYWSELAISLSIFLLYFKLTRPKLNDIDMKIKYLIILSLILLLVGIIFTAWLPTPIMIQLQLGRNLFLIIWLSLIYLSSLIYYFIKFIDNKYKSSPFKFVLFTSILFYSLFIIIALVMINHVDFPGNYPRDYDEITRSWIDIQLWAKSNTAIEDRFIVPPDMQPSFRIFSERSTVFQLADSAPICFSYNYAKEWIKRYELFYDYDNISEEKLDALAHQFGAEYVVTYKDEFLNKSLIYKNNVFNVYKLSAIQH